MELAEPRGSNIDKGHSIADGVRVAGLLAQLIDSRQAVSLSVVAARVPGYRDDLDSVADRVAADLDLLTALGLHVDVSITGEETMIALARESWEPRPVHLDAELRGLLDLAMELAGPHDEALDEALGALDAKKPPSPADTTVSLTPRIVVAPNRADVYSRLHRLAGQMTRGIVAGFGYADDSGERAERSLEVFGLGQDRGVWFAVGHEPGTEGVRAFAVAEMLGPVADLSDPGAYEVPAGHDATPYIALGWRLGPEIVPCEVEFDSQIAPYIAAAIPDVPFTVLDDGSLAATLDVGDEERFIGWAMTFGTHARIVSPESLVTRAIEVAREMAVRNG